MILASKFDVLRGWPREGALDESFLAAADMVSGTVVKVDTDGLTVVAASTPDLTSDDPVATWVVVEGTDDFSGTFVGKVVCLRANAMLRVDSTLVVSGTYTPGKPVSFDSGQFKVAAAGDQIVGEVIKDDTAVDGTIVIYYSGGTGLKK